MVAADDSSWRRDCHFVRCIAARSTTHRVYRVRHPFVSARAVLHILMPGLLPVGDPAVVSKKLESDVEECKTEHSVVPSDTSVVSEK